MPNDSYGPPPTLSIVAPMGTSAIAAAGQLPPSQLPASLHRSYNPATNTNTFTPASPSAARTPSPPSIDAAPFGHVNRPFTSRASSAIPASLALAQPGSPLLKASAPPTPPVFGPAGPQHNLDARLQLPLTLPLPLLSSLNADLAQSTVSPAGKPTLRRMSSIANARQSLLTVMDSLDWFLPRRVKDRRGRSISLEDEDVPVKEGQEKGVAVEKRGEHRVDGDGVAPVDGSAVSSPSATSASSAHKPLAVSSCSSCRQFGQHVCVWKWRGLVLILVLLLLSCLILASISNHYQYPILTTVYYSVACTSLLLLFHIQQLPSHSTDAFFLSFPSHLTAGLFVLSAFQSFYLGLAQPFSLFFPSITVTAAAIFLINTAAGIRYYLYSLLLIVAVWARSWWQDDTVVGDEQVLDFLREQYIIYTPLCLTLLTCLLLLIQQWLTHSVSLLTHSIHNLLQLKNSALAASKLKSEFLANVSHDIRTPMNSILGFLQLSVGDASLSDETRECLQTAFNSAEDLLSLLNDILDLTKIESGYLRFESIEFALQSVYEKSVKTFASQAAKKGVELIYEVDPQLQARQYAQVKGDPSRLAQVLNNLLSNAVKFTSSKGKAGGHAEILVRVSLLTPIQPGYIHVHTAVMDTGEGISAAGLTRLFQPFIQADATISRRHGGTGLGLAISSELVKLSGGRIWCQSEVGKGSSFNFTSQFQAIELTSSQPTDLFSALSADTHIHDGNLVTPAPPLSSSPTAIMHASSEPMPSRRIGDGGEQKRIQVRVLLAVHNPTNAEVISRAISYWTNREYANCSASTPCAKCQSSPFSFNPAMTHAHHAHHSSGLAPHSPPQHPDAMYSPTATGSGHHTTYIEIIPSHRVQTDHVVQELLWAKTTRQPYDLLVLDENAPQLDTVRLMSLMLKKRIYSLSRPAVLILTQRLLSPVLRGNGVSTYVLISKPVMAGDINKALSLLLREQPAEQRSMPVLPRRLGVDVRVADAATADTVVEGKVEKGYVASSRRPKDAVDEHHAAVHDASTHKLDDLHLDTANLDKSETNGVLREPCILSREEHGSGLNTHSTSAPSSPVGVAALSSPTPSSAPVDGGLEYMQNLPASQGLTWDGRTQSFPDFFFRQSSVNASQSLTQQTVKPRSQSLATDAMLSGPGVQHPLFTAPSGVLSAASGVGGAGENVKQTVQSEESEKPVAVPEVVEPRVKAVLINSVPPRPSVELDSPRATSDFISGSTSSTPSGTASNLPSSPSSVVHSPQHRSSSAKDSHAPGLLARDSWPSSPPRHATIEHAPHSGSRSTVAPSRRLLPTHQALPSHVLAATEGRNSTPSSPIVRNRLASFNSTSTHSGSRASSVSDISPALMSSGPASPASAASVDSAYSPDSTVSSPALATALSTASSTASSRLQPAADSVHVLCVDDNAINLKVASKMLSRLGYIPHTLRSGEEAIAFLDDMRHAWQRRQQARDGEWPELIRGPSAEEDVRTRGLQDVQRWVVLMDVIMEGMNGMEATRVLRAHGHAMPILALTANVMAGDKDKAMESGMDGFICKPLRLEELETALKAALKKRDEGAVAVAAGAAGGEGEKEMAKVTEEPVVLLGTEA